MICVLSKKWTISQIVMISEVCYNNGETVAMTAVAIFAVYDFLLNNGMTRTYALS